MERYCFLNDKIINIKQAKISITDIGVLRGFGVFDFLRVYNGQPFLFQKHLKRFEDSAKLTGLKIPFTIQKIHHIIIQLLKRNNLKNADVRIVLTGGESSDGINCNRETPTFFILMQKMHQFDTNLYQKGVALITHEFQRENAGAKTNNYLTRIKLGPEIERKKAHEVLYIKNGKVLEGATCNIFAVVRKSLITPRDNILLGTRRSLMVDLAKNYFQVRERRLTLREVKRADEVFITSTTRGVLPVTKIDGQKIGDGMVGAKTKKLMEIYRQYIKENT